MAAIVLRNMAKVELPEEHRLEVLQMYAHFSRTGDVIKNYKYRAGTAYLPLNPAKLDEVAKLLNAEIEDRRSEGAPLSQPFRLSFDFSLRPHQQAAAPALLKEVQKNKYAVIQADCGLGKTIVLSWAAGFLGTKILILVDMGSLQSQWQDAFQMVWERDVQVIKKNSTSFADVCVATFQLLHLNPALITVISKEFGCLLLDEFHTTQSDTRREVLFRLDNQYRIGCTATPYKKNYSDEVLSDLVADVSIVMSDENALKADVSFVATGAKFFTNNPDDWGRIQSKLASNTLRNQKIAKETLELINQDRKVLVIGITVESLHEISSYLQGNPRCRSVVYTGSTSLKRDRKLREDLASGKINCILTVKKTDKGMDLPALDALVLARPGNNKAFLTQIAGRIVRPVEGKPVPLIKDLVDVCQLGNTFAYNRQRWYKGMGYTISVGVPKTNDISFVTGM